MIKVLPRQGRLKKDRAYYRADGSRGPDWAIPNSDLNTALHAIKERVYLVKTDSGYLRPPVCTADVTTRCSAFLNDMRSSRLRHGRVSPVTPEEFLDEYSGIKRKRYERAQVNLEDRGFRKSDATVKLFVKDEYLKPGGAPRAIQPRSPEFNICIGRYIKQLEHPIYDAINWSFSRKRRHKHTTVAKGMNQEQRGAEIASMWDSFKHPVALSFDAARWDQHICEKKLRVEHSIYLDWCQRGNVTGLPALDELLKHQLTNRGEYRGKDGTIKYKVKGCRMSGDMNTSMGNVIIMCMLMRTFFQELRIPQVELLNDGDDCVIITEKKFVKKILKSYQKWFYDFGVTMKLDGIGYSMEEIDFCQCRPVCVDNKWVMVPRPTKRLYSDLITSKNVTTHTGFSKQMGAIAGCGLAGCSGVPIYQEFYTWMSKENRAWIPDENSYYYKYRDELVRGLAIRRKEISLKTRISFMLAHGTTPSEQILLENYYRDKPPLIYSPPENITSRCLDPPQTICHPEQLPQT